jgi:hypothetical protein
MAEFEKLKKEVEIFATKERVREVETDVLVLKREQKTNAKRDEVEKEIKQAKDNIYIHMRKYLKKDIFLSKVRIVDPLDGRNQ